MMQKNKKLYAFSLNEQIFTDAAIEFFYIAVKPFVPSSDSVAKPADYALCQVAEKNSLPPLRITIAGNPKQKGRRLALPTALLETTIFQTFVYGLDAGDSACCCA